MSTLEIGHSSQRLIFSGAMSENPRPQDYVEFTAALVGEVTASIRVTSDQPLLLAAFFADLAANWRGWTGAKTHESPEHELRITATHDGVGYVTLVPKLCCLLSGVEWSAEVTLGLEPGQLEALAHRAKAYFLGGGDA
jgi:hypothetical protein